MKKIIALIALIAPALTLLSQSQSTGVRATSNGYTNAWRIPNTADMRLVDLTVHNRYSAAGTNVAYIWLFDSYSSPTPGSESVVAVTNSVGWYVTGESEHTDWTVGTPVKTNSSFGTVMYLRPVGSTNLAWSIHSTLADATNNVNKVIPPSETTLYVCTWIEHPPIKVADSGNVTLQWQQPAGRYITGGAYVIMSSSDTDCTVSHKDISVIEASFRNNK